MNRNGSKSVYRMAVAALLCAVGIVIPMIIPKVPIGPAGSITLAVHVPTFLAMYLSPMTAIVVAIGTTLGFFFTAPFPIVLRAASHLVWAVLGALWIRKRPDLLKHPGESALFCVVIAAVHAICEVLAVLPLYYQGGMADKGGVFLTVFIMVGAATLVHSAADFIISLVVWRAVRVVGPVRSIASAN